MASLRTADDVNIDFCGRRRGILKALTAEVDKFFNECSPEKDNLCLYGYADGSWEVALPCEEVPPELPEPALGINFARDGMKRPDWLSLVAVHSDSWLMSVAFYNAARLDQEGRRQLFNNINSLPTVYEVVSGRAPNTSTPNAAAAQVAKRATSNQPAAVVAAAAGAMGGGGAYLGEYGQQQQQQQAPKRPRPTGPPKQTAKYRPAHDVDEDDEDDSEEEEGGGNSEPCPNCGRMYRRGEFWIACDHCDRWFDGKCVNMTEKKAEAAKDWRCPFCMKGA